MYVFGDKNFAYGRKFTYIMEKCNSITYKVLKLLW